MDARSSLVFYVNARRVELSGRACLRTLADFLRRDLSLTGTKVVCAEGDCGACTVLVGSFQEDAGGRLRYRAVNSCILPLYALDASHVITVEGLKDGENLHPVQSALVGHHASQCGYCTPGFACSMTALAEEAAAAGKPSISEKRARNGLTGNLCRCTGYESILKAAQSIPLKDLQFLGERFEGGEMMRELQELSARPVALESEGAAVFIPLSLGKALDLKKGFPGMKVVGGATDTGVLANKGIEESVRVMSLRRIEELGRICKDGEWAVVGSAVTLNALEPFAEVEVPELGRLLHVFASPQIKNRATLAGNVVNASPVGDLIPFLMVSDAELELKSSGAGRRVALADFYKGYRKTDLRPGELLTAVRLRLPSSGSFTRIYKASRRKDLDISTVTFAARVEHDGRVIRSARIALGGVASTVVRIKALEDAWAGSSLERGLFEKSALDLGGLISPISDVRGSKEFRLALCRNLLRRFAGEILSEASS